MKIYKVVPLGQNDEKGEQLENQEFREKNYCWWWEGWVVTNWDKMKKILGFSVGSEWWEGWEVVKSRI